MFIKDKAYKAAGICFNNIGNLQFKNENFDYAANNFYQSIQYAKLGCNELKNKTSDIYYYFKIKEAHRTYLYSISLYKYLRHGNKIQNLDNDPNGSDNFFDTDLSESEDNEGDYEKPIDLKKITWNIVDQ